MIDNGINRDRGLAGLTVADNQFPLTAANGNHGVNRLDTRLHRAINRFARHNAGRHFFHRIKLLGFYLATAVNRLSNRVDHPAQKLFPHRYGHNAFGALHSVAFFNRDKVPQDNRADCFLFQIQSDADCTTRKLQHLLGAAFFQAAHSGNTVADRNDRAHFLHLGGGAESIDIFPD